MKLGILILVCFCTATCIGCQKGKLSHFAACLSKIRNFLVMKNVEHSELADTEWLLKFYYLVYMTGHLNQLNVKMYCVGNTILALQQTVFEYQQ